MANKLVIRLVLLFFLAQLIGLAILNQYIDFQTTATTGVTTTNNENYVVQPPQIENESYSFVVILFAVLVGTALIFLFIKYDIMIIWKLWFFGSISVALTYALYPFVKYIIPATLVTNGAFTLTIIVAVLLGYFKIFKPTYVAHTISELFIYGGLAALFVPIINLTSAIILLLLLAAYDYYMVNQSGHMVTLAKASMKSQLIAGLYVGNPTTNSDNKSNDKHADAHHAHKQKEVKGKIIVSDTTNENVAPTTSVMVGGGDIAFPLFFAGAVMKYAGTLGSGLLVVLGATAGLIWLFSISKRGKFYPAIPFIAVGCFAALAIVYFF